MKSDFLCILVLVKNSLLRHHEYLQNTYLSKFLIKLKCLIIPIKMQTNAKCNTSDYYNSALTAKLSRDIFSTFNIDRNQFIRIECYGIRDQTNLPNCGYFELFIIVWIDILKASLPGICQDFLIRNLVFKGFQRFSKVRSEIDCP